MENLPEDLISDVIRRLTKSSDRNSVSLVSKELYKIEADQKCSIRIGCGLNPVTKVLTLLCLRFPNLTKIEITYSGWEPNLGKQFDDQGLFIISTYCPSLTDLTLSSCSFITGSGLSHLAACKKLVHLSIVKCRAILENSLLKIGNCLRRLQRLEFQTDLGNWDPRFYDPLVAESWFTHQICCEKLKELSLAKCILEPKSGSSLILGSCCSLEKVCLDSCFGLDDSDIIALSEKSCGLKSISLKSFSVLTLTDTSLKALCRNCPSLENVELAILIGFPSLITIEGILALINGCSIRVLVLKHARFLNDSAMEALSLASPCLETLEIEKAHEVTDLGIGYVINFPHLVNLKITDCNGITDDGFKPLFESNKLDYLKIEGCRLF